MAFKGKKENYIFLKILLFLLMVLCLLFVFYYIIYIYTDGYIIIQTQ